MQKEDLDPFLVNSYSSKESVFTHILPIRFFVAGKDIDVNGLTIFMAVSDESLEKEINTITGITDIETITPAGKDVVWKTLISNI